MRKKAHEAISLEEVYPTEDDFQILGNIPIDKRRPKISDDQREAIKYMRKRIEIKHRNLELDRMHAEQAKRLKFIEDEMAKDDNGENDFSKYMFDNVTGKVTDISRDFRLSSMAEDAKRGKFQNELASRTRHELLEGATNVNVKP